VLLVGVDDPVEQHAQQHSQPYEAGEDWEPLYIVLVSLR
jgi:hypothetical protein